MNRPHLPPARLRPSRRSSFARRDSNLALIGALIAGVVIAFALLLLLIQRINPEQGSRLRGAAADVVAPLVSVVRWPFDALGNIGQTVRAHWRIVETNQRLEAELARTRATLERAEATEAELRRLQRLVGLRAPERQVIATTVASAQSPTAGRRQALLAAGLNAGVAPRMPVIAAEGLAGRVTDAGRHAARMMLLTDADSRVPVRVVRTGWTGLAVGTGGTLLEFHYDPGSATERLRPGDRLVTSGDGGLFPPDIPVAVLVATDRAPPLARPLANPVGLGAVTVERPWLPPTLLPEAPSPDAGAGR